MAPLNCSCSCSCSCSSTVITSSEMADDTDVCDNAPDDRPSSSNGRSETEDRRVQSRLPPLSDYSQEALFRLMTLDPFSQPAIDLAKKFPELEIYRMQMCRRFTEALDLAKENQALNPPPQVEEDKLRAMARKYMNKDNAKESSLPAKKKARKNQKARAEEKMNFDLEIDFKLPPRRHVAKIAEQEATTSAPQSNKFESLQETMLDDPNMKLEQELVMENNREAEAAKTKKYRIKPIYMYKYENFEDVILGIAENASKQFTAKPAKDFVKIMPANAEENDKISKYFIEKHIEMYVIH